MSFDKDYEETHTEGIITLETLPDELLQNKMLIGDLGIQIQNNKVWICINGVAFIRFNGNPDIVKIAKTRDIK